MGKYREGRASLGLGSFRFKICPRRFQKKPLKKSSVSLGLRSPEAAKFNLNSTVNQGLMLAKNRESRQSGLARKRFFPSNSWPWGSLSKVAKRCCWAVRTVQATIIWGWQTLSLIIYHNSFIKDELEPWMISRGGGGFSLGGPSGTRVAVV